MYSQRLCVVTECMLGAYRSVVWSEGNWESLREEAGMSQMEELDFSRVIWSH
jgi:hypothetical protein